MINLIQVLILSLGFGLILSIVIYLLMRTQIQIMEKALTSSNSQLETQFQLNQTLILETNQKIQDLTSQMIQISLDASREMMDRTQAGDLKTLLSLQANHGNLSPIEQEVLTRTDAAEIQILSQGQELGQVSYDD